MAVAVILGGGKGTRFGDPLPKQFKVLGGKPIIQYTLEAFYSHPAIDEIIVTYPVEYRKEIAKITAPFSKNRSIWWRGCFPHGNNYGGFGCGG